MDFLNSMVEVCFKKSNDGKDIFFPFGTLSKGRIIPNENEKSKIRDFLKYYYSIGLSMFLVAPILKLYIIIFALVYLFFYIFKIYRIINTFEISQVKLSSREALERTSKVCGKGFIIFCLIFGIIIFLLGIFLYIYLELDFFASIGFSGIGLFIFFCYLRMLLILNKCDTKNKSLT